MIPNYIKKYCNYTIQSQKYGLSFSKITYLSYGQKAEKFNDDNNAQISRQSIYLHEKQHINHIHHRKRKRNTKTNQKIKYKSKWILQL